MAQRSTKLRTNKPADYAKSFTDGQINAVTALDTITKFPPYGPGRTLLKCTTTGIATVTLEDGSDHLVDCTAGETAEVPVTIKAFKSRTGVFSARCYWWYCPQLDENQTKPPLNS